MLRDPVARVEYLLELEGMRKEGEHKQQAPPELLEEVFELNESLDELREAKSAGANLDALSTRLRAAEKNFGEKLHEVDAELKTAAQQWDAALDANASDADREAVLQRLNELLNRRSLHPQSSGRRGKRIDWRQSGVKWDASLASISAPPTA